LHRISVISPASIRSVRLRPRLTVRRGLIVLAVPVLVALGLGVTAPAAGPSTVVIAQGVRIAGVPVGGMTSEPARELLRARFGQPVRFAYGERRWDVQPWKLGAGAAVDEAVGHALRARTGESVPLRVYVGERPVRRYVRSLAARFSRKPESARLAGLVGLAPSITRDRPGIAVRMREMQRAIAGALRTGDRGRPLPLLVRMVEPKVTREEFGPVIVIRRESKALYLYDGSRPVRTFGVATGQWQYPTPLGLFNVVDKQLNPWWRPPDSDWAKGLEPIPPGPGNPLGTRWMGLSAPGVGIHGTPDAASIGYSASHGCIRMRIPDAEWLFGQVTSGTPVYIVSA
jgi:lipoprotein-anchoring transpeptidase ErfK/SrfK